MTAFTAAVLINRHIEIHLIALRFFIPFDANSSFWLQFSIEIGGIQRYQSGILATLHESDELAARTD